MIFLKKADLNQKIGPPFCHIIIEQENIVNMIAEALLEILVLQQAIQEESKKEQPNIECLHNMMKRRKELMEDFKKPYFK